MERASSDNSLDDTIYIDNVDKCAIRSDRKSLKDKRSISIEVIPDQPNLLALNQNQHLDLYTHLDSDKSKCQSSPSLLELVSSLSYGVDWSDKATPISHCWIPYSLNNSLNSVYCSYESCETSEFNCKNSFVECGSCGIYIHKDHLIQFEKDNDHLADIPRCRPSFSDEKILNNPDEYDEHYWSSVSTMVKSCILCQRKTFRRTKINSDQSKIQSDKVKESNCKFVKHSNNVVCLWCSRYCHRQCLKSINDDNQSNKCDYGIFKNIIVRPQWISRIQSHPSIFESRYSDDIDKSNLSLTPLIVFINKISGGQKGETLYRKLVRLLNPRQVFLLENDRTVKRALDIYSSLSNIRICVCGGDGTIGWILSSLGDLYPSLNNPPVSICPLGTGNDLSRVFGWGADYNDKRLMKTLLQSSKAQSIALDRWKVDFESLKNEDLLENSSNEERRFFFRLLNHPKFVDPSNRPSYQNHRTPLNSRFTNYISFGLDAAVVLDFHHQRLENPSKFTSPLKNKIIYLNISRTYFKEFALWRTWNLASYIKLECDGRDLTHSLRHCHTLILLNIPSYGSGTHPWMNKTSIITNSDIDQDSNSNLTNLSNSDQSTKKKKKKNQIERQSINDQKLEVIGLDSVQMALIHIGFRGRRIAQCNQVRIELIRSMPVHMDGDPFYLPQSIAVNVTHNGQVRLLNNQQS